MLIRHYLAFALNLIKVTAAAERTPRPATTAMAMGKPLVCLSGAAKATASSPISLTDEGAASVSSLVSSAGVSSVTVSVRGVSSSSISASISSAASASSVAVSSVTLALPRFLTEGLLAAGTLCPGVSVTGA